MTTTEGYALLPIEELHESPLNPRKHFDRAALEELAGSIAAKGILTPLLVRPNAKGFEVGAGHRRLRAAKIVGLGQLPAVVRQMSDADFLELLVVENDQREDVHPLEQAEGYKRLMLLDSYDAKRIAERIGRSEKWVYDRMKLLQLTPLAQQLFLAGKMSAGHAILIARLTKEQQERIVGVDDETYDERHLALFQSERGGEDLWDPSPAEEKVRAKDPMARYDGYKPVSVRELDAWINEHVRLDPKTVDPFLFPEVAAAVEQAPKDLVPLTRETFVQEEARDGKVRTWGPRAWKDVEPKKPCQYARPGIIVVGPGRGEVLQVCLSTNRDKCSVHWSKEKKEAEQRRKQLARAGTSSAPARTDEARKKQQLKEERDRTIQEETDKRVAAEILGDVVWPLSRTAAEFLLDMLTDDLYSIEFLAGLDDLDAALAKKLHKPETLKPAELARALVGVALGMAVDHGNELALKRFKIDRTKIEKAVAAELKVQEEGEEPVTSKPKKKAAKK